MKSFDEELNVYSAGTIPSKAVHQKAIKVMEEVGIDISGGYPKNVEQFLGESFDYVITVCDNAKETCPVFTGNVNGQLHIGFADPADAAGTEEEIINEFRKVRDQIKERFWDFYNNKIKK